MAIYSIVGREAAPGVENKRGTLETPLPLNHSSVALATPGNWKLTTFQGLEGPEACGNWAFRDLILA
jgi:hypothetical protein